MVYYRNGHLSLVKKRFVKKQRNLSLTVKAIHSYRITRHVLPELVQIITWSGTCICLNISSLQFPKCLGSAVDHCNSRDLPAKASVKALEMRQLVQNETWSIYGSCIAVLWITFSCVEIFCSLEQLRPVCNWSDSFNSLIVCLYIRNKK